MGAGRHIRVYEADQGVGMTEAEALSFLKGSRSVVKLGTVDAAGDPNVHPVWYCFDSKGPAIYAFVGNGSKKSRNMKKSSSVYFLVDQDRWPYRGVRGKGVARELAAGARTMAIAERILSRYIRKDHPMFAQFVTSVKKRTYVVVEVRPRYFSTWDYGKMPASALSAGLD